MVFFNGKPSKKQALKMAFMKDAQNLSLQCKLIQNPHHINIGTMLELWYKGVEKCVILHKLWFER